jgi:hypothetical protein
MWLAMRPFMHTPYDWNKLFLMQAVQPHPGDAVYSKGDDSDLGHDWDPNGLRQASNYAKIVTAVQCLKFLIIIPFSLYGTGNVFSRNFFTGWTVVVFIWSWCAALLI